MINQTVSTKIQKKDKHLISANGCDDGGINLMNCIIIRGQSEITQKPVDLSYMYKMHRLFTSIAIIGYIIYRICMLVYDLPKVFLSFYFKSTSYEMF